TDVTHWQLLMPLRTTKNSVNLSAATAAIWLRRPWKLWPTSALSLWATFFCAACRSQSALAGQKLAAVEPRTGSAARWAGTTPALVRSSKALKKSARCCFTRRKGPLICRSIRCPRLRRKRRSGRFDAGETPVAHQQANSCHPERARAPLKRDESESKD